MEPKKQLKKFKWYFQRGILLRTRIKRVLSVRQLQQKKETG
jgi:hypothetical protein